MIWWLLLVLFLIVLGLTLYLFIAPFYLEIDNSKEIYRFRFHHIAQADLRFINDSVYLDLQILWIQRKIDLLEPKVRSEPMKKKVKVKVKRKRNAIPWSKLKGVMKSFKWDKCNVALNTGEMSLNGILYPVVYWVGYYTEKNIRIVFLEDTTIELKIRNSLARMSWAFFEVVIEN